MATTRLSTGARLTPRAALAALVSMLALPACGGTHSTATGSASSTSADAGPGADAGVLPAGCEHTPFEGDSLCIAAPPPDKGFQVHVGPTSYDDPDELAKYLIDPSSETNDYYFVKSGNAEDIYFYERNYRMRPHSHHLIVSEVKQDHPDGWNTTATGSTSGDAAAPAAPSGIDLGRRLGGSQNESKDNPIGGVLPPENEGIGMPLSAHAQLSVNLHHYNPTDHQILREAWVNFWYVDAATVTEEAKEMFAVGGFAMAIQPGEHKTLHYSCPVKTDGRVLTMYGHRHAHGDRFTAWRTRGGQQDLVYDGFNWQEPLVLEFSSLTQNPAPDPATKKEGGWNGPLDLKTGDVLEWECEVNNTTSGVLRFTNETVAGEMCILVGDTIGPSVSCVLP